MAPHARFVGLHQRCAIRLPLLDNAETTHKNNHVVSHHRAYGFNGFEAMPIPFSKHTT